MAKVSTIPAYILANENLLMKLLREPFSASLIEGNRDKLQELVQLDFHRWNSTRPDHVFQNRWKEFEYNYIQQKDKVNRCGWQYADPGDGKSNSHYVLASLECLVDEYIEIRHHELHIKLDKFGWWQNMLSRMSPLPILAWAYVKLEERYTQLPSLTERKYRQLYPYDAGVESYIAQQGLNDVHVHANMCAYAEDCWLEALDHTEEEWLEQEHEYRRNVEVPMLYRLVHVDLTPRVMEHHMEIAKRLRYILINYARDRKVPWKKREVGEREKLEELEADGLLATLSFLPPIEWDESHVSSRLGEPRKTDTARGENLPDTTAEMKWMMQLLRKQMKEPNKHIEKAFFFYLLLMNEYYMFCVQRENSYGFKQFQRYSSVQKYVVSQPFYFRGIFQRMHGGGTNSVAHYVELRISPADDKIKFQRKLLLILWGYLEYVWENLDEKDLSPEEQYRHRCGKYLHGWQDVEAEERYAEAMDEVLNELEDKLQYIHHRTIQPAIVVHLIKKPWKPDFENKRVSLRYKQNRDEYERLLNLLKELFEGYPKLRRWVRGIDAAADELETPPDVFAPTYRKARYDLNLLHATYHVGEDFCHLVSGIRVVCEAVDFLQLRSGDRIGHATALGVDPTLWRETMPIQITLKRGDWLLDLLYAWNLLQGQRQMDDVIQRLIDDICQHGYAIFQKQHVSSHFLKKVFDLRHLDPLVLMDMFHRAVSIMEKNNYNPDAHFEFAQAVEEIRKLPNIFRLNQIEEGEAYRAFCREAPEVMEMLLMWQSSKEIWERSQARIEIPADYFSDEILELLQRLAMRKLVEKSIVVETLPTSNLRIGQYREMGQHHSLRWLKADSDGGEVTPLVALGTDDPGVFFTDIKGEFYHIFASLCKRGVNAQRALDILIRVNQCGERYAFRSLTGNFVEEGMSVNANYGAVSLHL